MKGLLITIDGPSGAGKTTVSRKAARRLGYTYVDTGALYRAVAFAASRQYPGMPLDDTRLKQVCRDMKLEFKNTEGGSRLLLNGVDVSKEIRTQEMTMLASRLSAQPVVRKELLEIQRSMAREGGVVFEGRDMGTVVFPDADIKFFLFADPEIRARRRYLELVAGGHTEVTYEEVFATMKKRDRDDASRALAPLKPAEDAVRIDSSELTEDEVVDRILSCVRNLSK
jgi:cytidylate kinase